jgi:hypothetical protein
LRGGVKEMVPMTTVEILEMMVPTGSRIVLLRTPTPQYRKHVAVCHADGLAVHTLRPEVLEDLVAANLVERDVSQNDGKFVFQLTQRGREVVKKPLEKYLRARLLSLGYPWSEYLEGKNETPGPSRFCRMVRCNFLISEFWDNETRMLTGWTGYRMRFEAADWKISAKQINLINCDQCIRNPSIIL